MCVCYGRGGGGGGDDNGDGARPSAFSVLDRDFNERTHSLAAIFARAPLEGSRWGSAEAAASLRMNIGRRQCCLEWMEGG